MDTPRLLRTCGTVLAVAGTLLSACSTSSTGHSAAASLPPNASAAASLAASASSAVDLTSYYDQKLSWHSCLDAAFQCATMKVPLDYAHPNPATDLKIAVARKKAAGPGKRLGSLLVNPGGPGASGIDYLRYAATAAGFPAAVRARYDMAAFDPRGVDRSEPVICLTDQQMDAFTESDVTPDDQSETNKLVAADKTFDNGCEKRSGKLLGHVSTVESARDMDIFRALLGDNKLTYVGESYGTFLGATYAELFPKRVGRLVLDGALDPSVSARESSRAQAGGFQTAFNAFAANCVKLAACPLGSKSVADAGHRLDQLLAKLDGNPLSTGTTRKLTESLGTTGVIYAMYSNALWPSLRTALTKAEKGDGSGLLQLSDAYYERTSSGKYPNLMYANAAVNCLDAPPAFTGPAAVESAVPSFERTSSHFGRNLAWASLLCAYWPVPATGRPHRITAPGAAPILVVGTTRDPATPYDWAKSLASQLTSGVLLTYDGDGHTAYNRGSECIDSTINGYLLGGAVPADGKTCS